MRNIVRHLVLAGATVAIGAVATFGAAVTSAVTPARPDATPAASRPIAAVGRVAIRPGGRVTLSSPRGGRIEEIPFAIGAHVDREDVVIRFDADLIEAEAVRASALASATSVMSSHADVEARRARQLVGLGVVGETSLEDARFALRGARAQVRAARAARRAADAMLEESVVRAPIGGTVVDWHAAPGEVVGPGMPVVTLIDLEQMTIEAEVDELDVGRVAVGQRVRIRADGYAESWEGEVERLPVALRARSPLRPGVPAAPPSSMVLLVTVRPLERLPLAVGQSVDVVIATTP